MQHFIQDNWIWKWSIILFTFISNISVLHLNPGRVSETLPFEIVEHMVSETSRKKTTTWCRALQFEKWCLTTWSTLTHYRSLIHVFVVLVIKLKSQGNCFQSINANKAKISYLWTYEQNRAGYISQPVKIRIENMFKNSMVVLIINWLYVTQ